MKSLCGFLSPDGTFIECESWEHLDTAKKLVSEYYPNKTFQYKNRLTYEDFLFDSGWVSFTSRGASFRFRVTEGFSSRIQLLSDSQKEFMVLHLEKANNDDQRNSMLELLARNDYYQEDLLLQKYDDCHPERTMM